MPPLLSAHSQANSPICISPICISPIRRIAPQTAKHTRDDHDQGQYRFAAAVRDVTVPHIHIYVHNACYLAYLHSLDGAAPSSWALVVVLVLLPHCVLAHLYQLNLVITFVLYDKLSICIESGGGVRKSDFIFEYGLSMFYCVYFGSGAL